VGRPKTCVSCLVSDVAVSCLLWRRGARGIAHNGDTPASAKDTLETKCDQRSIAGMNDPTSISASETRSSFGIGRFARLREDGGALIGKMNQLAGYTAVGRRPAEVRRCFPGVVPSSGEDHVP